MPASSRSRAADDRSRRRDQHSSEGDRPESDEHGDRRRAAAHEVVQRRLGRALPTPAPVPTDTTGSMSKFRCGGVPERARESSPPRVERVSVIVRASADHTAQKISGERQQTGRSMESGTSEPSRAPPAAHVLRAAESDARRSASAERRRCGTTRARRRRRQRGRTARSSSSSHRSILGRVGDAVGHRCARAATQQRCSGAQAVPRRG